MEDLQYAFDLALGDQWHAKVGDEPLFCQEFRDEWVI